MKVFLKMRFVPFAVDKNALFYKVTKLISTIYDSVSSKVDYSIHEDKKHMWRPYSFLENLIIVFALWHRDIIAKYNMDFRG